MTDHKQSFSTGLKIVSKWTLLALVMHAIWEVAHLPLYTLWNEADRQIVVSYLLHCTLGDALIATTVFLFTSAIIRDWRWPQRNLRLGGLIMITSGLVYTVFSEWYNVYYLQSWGYDPAMPLIAGIGLTPLLQWLIVPSLMLIIARRYL
jgi:hypothetical protein